MHHCEPVSLEKEPIKLALERSACFVRKFQQRGLRNMNNRTWFIVDFWCL
jgi:hypothetical protein